MQREYMGSFGLLATLVVLLEKNESFPTIIKVINSICVPLESVSELTFSGVRCEDDKEIGRLCVGKLSSAPTTSGSTRGQAPTCWHSHCRRAPPRSSIRRSMGEGQEK